MSKRAIKSRVRDFALSWQRSRCYLCGRAVRRDVLCSHGSCATVDHVIPLALSGPNSGNVEIACRRCNARKDIAPPTPCHLFFARELSRAWRLSCEYKGELLRAINPQGQVDRVPHRAKLFAGDA